MSNKKRADLLSKEKKTGNAPYEKRRKKRRLSLMVVLVVLVIFLTIVSASVSVFHYTNTIKEERIQSAMGVTKLAAKFID